MVTFEFEGEAFEAQSFNCELEDGTILFGKAVDFNNINLNGEIGCYLIGFKGEHRRGR